MIAEVYPIMRMPRHVTVFDYAIPENLHHLKRGDVVVIPFRNNSVFGVISRIKETAEKGIRVKTILQQDSRITFSDKELSFFETLGTELVQSVPSILNSCLPTFPKRQTVKPLPVNPVLALTIHPSELESLQSIALELTQKNRAFVSLSDIKRMTCVIAGFLRLKPDQKCIVLCPTILDAQRVYAHLPVNTRLLLTGEENAGTQFAVWSAYRAQKSAVIVGTKNVLFSTDPETTTIFVLRSSHENHGHHEQNPRFDGRVVAQMLAQHYATNLFFFDVMPRVEDTIFFSEAERIGSQTNLSPRMIDMEHQNRASKIGYWISHEAYQATQECLDKKERVLMILNKKNHAKRLSCTSCNTDLHCSDCGIGFIVDDSTLRCVRCKKTEPIPLTCPKCQQATLKESGFGNQKIDELLRKEFPTVQTCVIDKEHPSIHPQAPLVIATSYYLEQMANAFSPDRFSLVVLLDADAPLYRKSYRASESALYECEGWRALSFANRAQVFVQTKSIPFFTEYFSDPQSSIQAESESRKMYEQPPFCEIISLKFQESNPQKAEVLLNHLIQLIRSVSKTARVKRQQNDSESSIEVRFTKTERPAFLQIFRSLPDHVIIDTHANTG